MGENDWSDAENDAAVDAYFTMLNEELLGRSYNKAALNRQLREHVNRSRGSVEFKHCNITAAAISLGLPSIDGYKPRYNFQIPLAEAVVRWLARHPHWDTSHIPHQQGSPEKLQLVELCPAPTLRNAPSSVELEKAKAIARHFDVAGRDERNRKLGRAGEECVFHFERMQLKDSGRDDLARRVRWVSQEDGDGAGYDIASFTPVGRDRLIEVKTTNGWERTPFHISRNELEVASERSGNWQIFRLYDFARTPRAFELCPPLETHVSLTATSFQADFR